MQERRIVVDTREQRPYIFDTNTITKKLDAGDYSIEGLESQIAIERKSLDDFINTVLRGKERFGRELVKLQEYEFAAVVIEGSFKDILSGNYTSKVRPEALFALLLKMILKYQPVNFIFAHDRPHALKFTADMLRLLEGYDGKHSD